MNTTRLLPALALVAALAGCASSSSSDSPASSSTTSAGGMISIGVNGMVCNFCATNLDGTFKKVPGVEDVYVNLDAKTVLLKTAPGATVSDDIIRKAIADAGFEVRDIRRSNDDFAKTRDAVKASAKFKEPA